MKRRANSDPDPEDFGLDLDDDVDVESFLGEMERRERRHTARGAWREIERRLERHMLAEDLEEYYNC